MTKTLCIWHGNCQDGFGAAWVVRHEHGDEVEFYPGVYQDAPPDVTGRDVILVDFSYKRPVLAEMAKSARLLIVIDHHKTSSEDLAGFPDLPPETAIWTSSHQYLGLPFVLFDMERSGAGMAWDYYHPGRPRPPLIDHIEDRDLWRFRLPETRRVAAALFSHPYDFALWDRFMTGDYPLSQLVVEGEAIERKHHQDIANLLPVVQRQMTIGGLLMPVACLPLILTSDAGHKMAAENGGVAACYWDTPKGRVFSLRSTDDGPDASAIAKAYGGGGHARAAGFRMPLGWEGDAS